ncbi:MAG: alginate export family protein [Enterobacterales bacterium]|nr:alginate export family protein [Enterobacterales bacterium]
MNQKFKINILAASIAALTSMAAVADNQIQDKPDTKVDLSFRYRIETVDQVGFIDNAKASTLRTRATVKTQWNSSFKTIIEFDDVSEIGWNDYNSGAGTSPNRTQFPVIADPQGSEVNQAYIEYSNKDNRLAIGRQRILIGNQRFVGGVGWRQNEQTYDGLTYKGKLTENLNFNYAYVYNVNRIFGETVAAGDHTHNTHLLNADYKIGKSKLSAYYFAIDNQRLGTFSNNTLGVRFESKIDQLDYILEFASQSEATNNPNSYQANYYFVDTKYHMKDFTFGGGIELLGGDSVGGQGFTTSLATLHGFQGWADVFLATPVTGINDSFVDFSYKVNGYKLKAIYHDFSSDELSLNYGTELDFVLSKKLTSNLTGMLKMANFSSDNVNYKSRDKVWIMFTYKL